MREGRWKRGKTVGPTGDPEVREHPAEAAAKASTGDPPRAPHARPGTATDPATQVGRRRAWGSGVAPTTPGKALGPPDRLDLLRVPVNVSLSPPTHPCDLHPAPHPFPSCEPRDCSATKKRGPFGKAPPCPTWQWNLLVSSFARDGCLTRPLTSQPPAPIEGIDKSCISRMTHGP